MVDTSTIDLPTTSTPFPPSVTPAWTSLDATQSSSASVNTTETALPDIELMQQELAAANLLIPEAMPTGLVTITTPTNQLELPPVSPAAITLASTAPTFCNPSGSMVAEKNTWKWLSWIFIVLSVVVLGLVVFQLWDQGMRIQVVTTEEITR